MVPDLIASWSSLWTWVKLLYPEHLQGSSPDILHVSAAARRRYAVLITFLASLTGAKTELLYIIAETDGYISVVTLAWMEESRNLNRNFEFMASALVSNLVIGMKAIWLHETVANCGGHTDDMLTICLDRLVGNLERENPVYDNLHGDLMIIFTAIHYHNSPFRKFIASSPRCVRIMVRAMNQLTSNAALYSLHNRSMIIMVCSSILSASFRLGGLNRILNALKAGLLPVLLTVSTFCCQLEKADSLLSIMLQHDTRYLIHRPSLSLLSAALSIIDGQGLERYIPRETNFARRWSDFQKATRTCLERKEAYKLEQAAAFICGNSHVSAYNSFFHISFYTASAINLRRRGPHFYAARGAHWHAFVPTAARSNPGRNHIASYAKTCNTDILVNFSFSSEFFTRN